MFKHLVGKTHAKNVEVAILKEPAKDLSFLLDIPPPLEGFPDLPQLEHDSPVALSSYDQLLEDLDAADLPDLDETEFTEASNTTFAFRERFWYEEDDRVESGKEAMRRDVQKKVGEMRELLLSGDTIFWAGDNEVAYFLTFADVDWKHQIDPEDLRELLMPQEEEPLDTFWRETLAESEAIKGVMYDLIDYFEKQFETLLEQSVTDLAARMLLEMKENYSTFHAVQSNMRYKQALTMVRYFVRAFQFDNKVFEKTQVSREAAAYIHEDTADIEEEEISLTQAPAPAVPTPAEIVKEEPSEDPITPEPSEDVEEEEEDVAQTTVATVQTTVSTVQTTIPPIIPLDEHAGEEKEEREEKDDESSEYDYPIYPGETDETEEVQPSRWLGPVLAAAVILTVAVVISKIDDEIVRPHRYRG